MMSLMVSHKNVLVYGIGLNLSLGDDILTKVN